MLWKMRASINTSVAVKAVTENVPEMQPKTEDPMACVNCRKEMTSNEFRWVDRQMTPLREDVVENSDPN